MSDGFEKYGYQIARGLIAEDVIADTRRFLQDRLEPTLERMRVLGIRTGAPEMVSDIKLLLSKPDAEQIDRDLRVIMTGHYDLEVRLDRNLWAIPQNHEVQKFVKTILKTQSLRLHMPPTARFVIPGNLDAGVPTHQDVLYNQHMSDFITFWVPLVEIDEACGGVTVFRGSDEAAHRADMKNHGIWFEEIDVSGYEAVDCVPMSPGDVLIFNKLLAHRSMPNISERIRFSLDYRFFAAGETSTKHYLDMDEWKVVAPNE